MDQNNTQSIIQERFKQLPTEVQRAITSTNLSEKFDAISKKYSLRIDQSGALQTETLLVMLGLEKPADYIENLVANAELSRSIASLVASDVNTEILGSIRGTLEKITAEEDAAEEKEKTTEESQSNNDLNKAGNMSVEKSLASEDVVSAVKKPTEEISRAATLNALENPPAFIDHLLTGTVTSVSETTIKDQNVQAPAPANAAATITVPAGTPNPVPKPQPAPYKSDPYRESIE